MFCRSYFYGLLVAVLSATQIFAASDLFPHLDQLEISVGEKEKLQVIKAELLQEEMHLLTIDDLSAAVHGQDVLLDMGNLNLCVVKKFKMTKLNLNVKCKTIVLNGGGLFAESLSIDATENIVSYMGILKANSGDITLNALKDIFNVKGGQISAKAKVSLKSAGLYNL